MIESVEVQEPDGLDAYADVIHLTEAVRALRTEAASLVAQLRGRKVWMVNSTSRGGGVAEMMPKLVSLLNELGRCSERVARCTELPGFDVLTKRQHILIHGTGAPALLDEDRLLYAAVSSENATELKQRLGPDDILVIHDPRVSHISGMGICP